MPPAGPQMPPAGPQMPPAVGGPGMPPPPQAEPEISVYLSVAGQQYGPFNRELCKQMVINKQLTPQSMVWMEGMAAWAPASQVPALQSLFAPAVPPVPQAGPQMPPTMPPTM